MSTLSDGLLLVSLGAVIGVAIKDGLPVALKAYRNRLIEPKKAHQRLLLEQSEWYRGRAKKLKALEWELQKQPPPDKFKLSLWLSKLDRQDQQWAMKISDLEQLQKAAADKAVECEDNAAEAYNFAAEVSHRLLVD